MLKKVLFLLLLGFLSGRILAFDQSQALDFALQDVDGQQHHLADYRGQWVVLNYWASWCPPCRTEIPDLISFHEQNDDVTLIGINQDRINNVQLKQLIDDYAIPYPVYADVQENQRISNILLVDALPASYFINPDGQVMDKYLGLISYDQLELKLTQLKAQYGTPHVPVRLNKPTSVDTPLALQVFVLDKDFRKLAPLGFARPSDARQCGSCDKPKTMYCNLLH